MTDVNSNQAAAPDAAASVPAAAEAKGPTIPWGRHSWLWLSLIGVGIAVLFFGAGVVAASVVSLATHSVHEVLQHGGPNSGDRPGFGQRGDGGTREFPGRPGTGNSSDSSDTAPSS